MATTTDTDDDLAELQRAAEARAAANWDPAEAALLNSGYRGRRRTRPPEPGIATLQREAEARAQAFWDPVELGDMVGRPSLLTGALVRAIEEAAEDFCSSGERVTPFWQGTYGDYLKTEHWAAMRLRMLQRSGGACQRCHTVIKRLDVHHLTYQRLGAERESDLLVLCFKCHADEHGETER